VYVHSGIYLCGGVGRGALNCHPKATNKKQNILTRWSLRVRSWNEEYRVGVAVVGPWGGAESCGDITRENRPSWGFVDDSDPVITAATAAEGDKSDLIQRQGNLVGYDIVLDIVRDALAESLEGKAEQSALDGNAVPSRGVSVPLIRTR